MYKTLSPAALGISGRQSEIIELALTYGFRGLDIDLDDLAKRAKLRGIERAGRFIHSAKIKIGTFDLPINWRGSEADYQADLARLPELCDVALNLGAKRAVATVLPASDELPYHENFELHRKRLAELATSLEARDIQLGLALLAAPAHRQDRRFEFIHQADALLLLLKTIGHANLGLLYDSWNWHVGGGTLDQLGTLKGEQIVGVRLVDVPADADLATITEEQRLLVGEAGTIDPVAVLSVLRDIKATGPVTIFPHPRRFSGMTRDAIVQRCANLLEDAWQGAGLPSTKAVAAAAGKPAGAGVAGVEV